MIKKNIRKKTIYNYDFYKKKFKGITERELSTN